MSDRAPETELGQRWLELARGDLASATRLAEAGEQGPPRNACYFAQQAVEKAIKAALASAQVDFPYTHDLDRLRQLVPDDWVRVKGLRDLASLTRYAVRWRYPNDQDAPTTDDAQAAVAQARRIVEEISLDLADHGVVPDKPDVTGE